MQRSLNAIDSKERANNIIISGMTENEIKTVDSSLYEDVAKIKMLFQKIGITGDIPKLPFTAQRIGKETGEKRRMLKVVLKDYDTREVIISNASKLKKLVAPWNKMYINRDTHPVYNKEHQRLQKKFNELKKRPDLQNPDSVKLI